MLYLDGEIRKMISHANFVNVVRMWHSRSSHLSTYLILFTFALLPIVLGQEQFGQREEKSLGQEEEEKSLGQEEEKSLGQAEEKSLGQEKPKSSKLSCLCKDKDGKEHKHHSDNGRSRKTDIFGLPPIYKTVVVPRKSGGKSVLSSGNCPEGTVKITKGQHGWWEDSPMVYFRRKRSPHGKLIKKPQQESASSEERVDTSFKGNQQPKRTWICGNINRLKPNSKRPITPAYTVRTQQQTKNINNPGTTPGDILDLFTFIDTADKQTKPRYTTRTTPEYSVPTWPKEFNSFTLRTSSKYPFESSSYFTDKSTEITFSKNNERMSTFSSFSKEYTSPSTYGNDKYTSYNNNDDDKRKTTTTSSELTSSDRRSTVDVTRESKIKIDGGRDGDSSSKNPNNGNGKTGSDKDYSEPTSTTTESRIDKFKTTSSDIDDSKRTKYENSFNIGKLSTFSDKITNEDENKKTTVLFTSKVDYTRPTFDTNNIQKNTETNKVDTTLFTMPTYNFDKYTKIWTPFELQKDSKWISETTTMKPTTLYTFTIPTVRSTFIFRDFFTSTTSTPQRMDSVTQKSTPFSVPFYMTHTHPPFRHDFFTKSSTQQNNIFTLFTTPSTSFRTINFNMFTSPSPTYTTVTSRTFNFNMFTTTPPTLRTFNYNMFTTHRHFYEWTTTKSPVTVTLTTTLSSKVYTDFITTSKPPLDYSTKYNTNKNNDEKVELTTKIFSDVTVNNNIKGIEVNSKDKKTEISNTDISENKNKIDISTTKNSSTVYNSSIVISSNKKENDESYFKSQNNTSKSNHKNEDDDDEEEDENSKFNKFSNSTKYDVNQRNQTYGYNNNNNNKWNSMTNNTDKNYVSNFNYSLTNISSGYGNSMTNYSFTYYNNSTGQYNSSIVLNSGGFNYTVNNESMIYNSNSSYKYNKSDFSNETTFNNQTKLRSDDNFTSSWDNSRKNISFSSNTDKQNTMNTTSQSNNSNFSGNYSDFTSAKSNNNTTFNVNNNNFQNNDKFENNSREIKADTGKKDYDNSNSMQNNNNTSGNSNNVDTKLTNSNKFTSISVSVTETTTSSSSNRFTFDQTVSKLSTNMENSGTKLTTATNNSDSSSKNSNDNNFKTQVSETSSSKNSTENVTTSAFTVVTAKSDINSKSKSELSTEMTTKMDTRTYTNTETVTYSSSMKEETSTYRSFTKSDVDYDKTTISKSTTSFSTQETPTFGYTNDRTKSNSVTYSTVSLQETSTYKSFSKSDFITDRTPAYASSPTQDIKSFSKSDTNNDQKMTSPTSVTEKSATSSLSSQSESVTTSGYLQSTSSEFKTTINNASPPNYKTTYIPSSITSINNEKTTESNNQSTMSNKFIETRNNVTNSYNNSISMSNTTSVSVSNNTTGTILVVNSTTDNDTNDEEIPPTLPPDLEDPTEGEEEEEEVTTTTVTTRITYPRGPAITYQPNKPTGKIDINPKPAISNKLDCRTISFQNLSKEIFSNGARAVCYSQYEKLFDLGKGGTLDPGSSSDEKTGKPKRSDKNQNYDECVVDCFFREQKIVSGKGMIDTRGFINLMSSRLSEQLRGESYRAITNCARSVYPVKAPRRGLNNKAKQPICDKQALTMWRCVKKSISKICKSKPVVHKHEKKVEVFLGVPLLNGLFGDCGCKNKKGEKITIAPFKTTQKPIVMSGKIKSRAGIARNKPLYAHNWWANKTKVYYKK